MTNVYIYLFMKGSDKQEELEKLYAHVSTILDFQKSKANTDTIFSEVELKIHNAYKDLKAYYSNYKFQGFKQACNDIHSWAKYLSEHDYLELNKIFLEKHGKELTGIEQKRQKTLKIVIKRGSINSDTEYYLINEILSDTEYKGGNRDILNKLLLDYEKK